MSDCGAQPFYKISDPYIAHPCHGQARPCANCGAMLCRHWNPIGCPRCLSKASGEWAAIATNYDKLIQTTLDEAKVISDRNKELEAMVPELKEDGK